MTTIKASTPPARPARSRRPVVALALSGLHGPGEGTMEVPRRLFWSGGEGCGRIDLGSLAAVAIAYESILDAARSPSDLAAYLNAGLLTVLWPQLGMTTPRRDAWEAVNPELAAARAAESSGA